jgi:tetratricopeptide (TPR) repeat protein
MRRIFAPVCWSIFVFAAGLCCGLGPQAVFAADYKTADEAYSVGVALARARNYAGSREPLEAALRLAPDDAYRLKVYEALMPAYRELPGTDKMAEAAEFVIAHADQRAKRSNESNALASFLFQRGKLDEAVSKYEARLKERPDDLVALSILNGAYRGGRRDNKERGAAVATTLAIVDKQLASQLADSLERNAAADPRSAAAQYKDAATAWLEAGDTPRALAAAKKSQASPPEDRSSVLKYFWHKGLGDVFAAANQAADAKTEYEAALNFAPGDAGKKELQKKLDEIKTKEKK